MLSVRATPMGEGPDVLLLYGKPAPRNHIEPLQRALSSAYRVWMVDLPGHGSNPARPSADGYTMESTLAAIESALLSCGVRDVGLIGFSSGGYRALALACRGTLIARAVVVLGGMARLTEDERPALLGFREAIASGRDLSDVALARFTPPDLAAARPDVVADVKSWVQPFDSSLCQELFALAHAPDLRPALRKLPCRVVARCGELDQAEPPARSIEIADYTGGVAEIVPGVGHLLLVQDFEGTLQSIRAALAR